MTYPRPDRKSLDSCLDFGWRYIEDIEDPLEHVNKLYGMTDHDRSPEIAYKALSTG